MSSAPISPTQLPPQISTPEAAQPNMLVTILREITRLFDTRGGLLVFGFATLYCTWNFILMPMQKDAKVDQTQNQKQMDANAVMAQDLASAMRDLRETAKTLKETALIQQGRQLIDMRSGQ